MQFGFGSGILTGLRNDNADSVTNTPIRFGALQEVSVEFAGDIKELFATQQFPIDSARGKTKINGKAKVAEVKSRMYNDLFFGQTQNTGGIKYAYNESTTVGTAAFLYTVSFSGSTPLADQGVFLASNGNQLQAVSSAPGANQYTFNPTTGVYTFNSTAAGLGMIANYTYTVSTGFTIVIGNPPMGTTPRFQVTLFQQYPNSSSQIVLILYSCVSNRLTFPTQIDDYVIQDLDFSAFANPAGNVGTWSSTN
jgi:hypothetical protein